MFPWSKKITKPVTFNSEVADDTLLAVVETELMKQPHKTFSDLCKEALWQFLCVPESVRPTTPTAGQMEQPVAELNGQLAQLSLIVNQQPKSESSRPFVPEVKQAEAVTPTAPPAEIDDPLLNRLSAFLDDF